MDITPVLSESAQRITAYGAGIIKVNQTEYTQPLLVQMHEAKLWENAGIDEASLQDLARQLETIEILLIGSGQQGEFLPPALRQMLRTQTGAGVEMMDTGAACRTYNVLLAEGRQVAAALLPV